MSFYTSDIKGVYEIDIQGYTQQGKPISIQKEFTVEPGDRIAQMLFFSVFTPDFKLVKNFDESERGIEGFGSSGKI